MLGGGGMATVQAPFSNTRCRQMVSKILIFWKWVLPWLCLISAFQTPTSYKWNDTCPFAFYAVNRVLRFGFWQSEFGFQIVKVPVFRHNNLLQNPTYFTLLEVIYLLSKVQIKYQDASIIVLAVDVLDQSLCVAERPYTKRALSSLSFWSRLRWRRLRCLAGIPNFFKNRVHFQNCRISITPCFSSSELNFLYWWLFLRRECLSNWPKTENYS